MRYAVIEIHENGTRYPVTDSETKAAAQKRAEVLKRKYPDCDYTVEAYRPAKIDYRTATLLGA